MVQITGVPLLTWCVCVRRSTLATDDIVHRANSCILGIVDRWHGKAERFGSPIAVQSEQHNAIPTNYNTLTMPWTGERERRGCWINLYILRIGRFIHKDKAHILPLLTIHRRIDTQRIMLDREGHHMRLYMREDLHHTCHGGLMSI